MKLTSIWLNSSKNNRQLFRTLGVVLGGALLTVSQASAAPLKIALEGAQQGTCQSAPGEVHDAVVTMLTARGHIVNKVDASAIDTLAEISTYDVVVFGAGNFSCDWDWATFDPVVSQYVSNGGGIVTSGWTAWYMQDNTKTETYPGLEAVLPVIKGTQYINNSAVTVLQNHPITLGISSFNSPAYINYGGGAKPGSTVFMTAGGFAAGEAWSVGSGRAVYLAPIYLADWAFYYNEMLLDGTDVNAKTLFIQAVEWAGYSPCNTNADCDDGDACNGVEQCSNGQCSAGTSLVCNDNNPCTDDTCNPASGCVFTNNTSPCDDGDACTLNEICANGICTPSAVVTCIALDNCHDVGVCDSVSGVCSNPPLDDGTPCSDGDACSQDDTCQLGVCTAGLAIGCDDANPCTNDTCNSSTGCEHSPLADDTLCDDGNPCNEGDRCVAGLCQATNGLDCDDQNPCTADSCDMTGQCIHMIVDDGTSCSDNSACTFNDSCEAGQCVGSAMDCDDNNDCTLDSCDSTMGCTHGNGPDGGSCSDGDACTQNDTCDAGVCVSGSEKNCSPGECQQNGSCDAMTGQCLFDSLPNGTACSAGQCENGECLAGGTGGSVGSGGSGGEAGTGGQSAQAGASGSGGSTSTAGTAGASNGAQAGTGGSSPQQAINATNSDEGGCGCRVLNPSTTNPLGWWGALAIGMAIVVARRKPSSLVDSNSLSSHRLNVLKSTPKVSAVRTFLFPSCSYAHAAYRF